jgi:hypothetical protein
MYLFNINLSTKIIATINLAAGIILGITGIIIWRATNHHLTGAGLLTLGLILLLFSLAVFLPPKGNTLTRSLVTSNTGRAGIIAGLLLLIAAVYFRLAFSLDHHAAAGMLGTLGLVLLLVGISAYTSSNDKPSLLDEIIGISGLVLGASLVLGGGLWIKTVVQDNGIVWALVVPPGVLVVVGLLALGLGVYTFWGTRKTDSASVQTNQPPATESQPPAPLPS